MSNILVIGDACKDVYTYCDSNRLAPDVPVPVLQQNHIDVMPGMAMNVVANLESLNARVDYIVNTDWINVLKNRYVHQSSNHMFIRIDSGLSDKKLNIKDIDFKRFNTIIISDYDKGFVSEENIEYICENHPRVFLDTKKILDKWALDATFIKINNYEYDRSKDFIEKYVKDKVIQTMGGDGCSYCGRIYPVDTVDVVDVSGAGDTFMASLAYKYTQSRNIIQSIKFANKSASKVVQKKGTTTL